MAFKNIRMGPCDYTFRHKSRPWNSEYHFQSFAVRNFLLVENDGKWENSWELIVRAGGFHSLPRETCRELPQRFLLRFFYFLVLLSRLKNLANGEKFLFVEKLYQEIFFVCVCVSQIKNLDLLRQFRMPEKNVRAIDSLTSNDFRLYRWTLSSNLEI